MKYTAVQLGVDLKELLKKTSNTEEIGSAVYNLYFYNITNIEYLAYKVAQDLAFMECGPEFAYSMEELHQIADDLIAGRDVKLD